MEISKSNPLHLPSSSHGRYKKWKEERVAFADETESFFNLNLLADIAVEKLDELNYHQKKRNDDLFRFSGPELPSKQKENVLEKPYLEGQKERFWRKPPLSIRKNHESFFSVEQEENGNLAPKLSAKEKGKEKILKEPEAEPSLFPSIPRERRKRRYIEKAEVEEEVSTSLVQNKKKKNRKDQRQPPAPIIDLNIDLNFPEMPLHLMNMISEMGGTEVLFILEKLLKASDVSTGHVRLAIPKNQIKQDFLRDDEKAALEVVVKRKHIGIEVLVFNNSMRCYELKLKKWMMTKTVMYNIVSGWKGFCKDNGFEAGRTIRIWTFRLGLQLCFVLYKL